MGFHGQSGTPDDLATQRLPEFDAFAARDGWVLAYPAGMDDGTMGSGWNVGTAGDNKTCTKQAAAQQPAQVDCYASCQKLGRCGRCNWSTLSTTCFDDTSLETLIPDFDSSISTLNILRSPFEF